MEVYYLNDRIVFKICKLVFYEYVLALYYLMPKPVIRVSNYCVYIQINHDYLAVSRSKALY